MQRLMEDVRLGTLDYVLTKSEDAQLLISLRQVQIWKLVDVALGLGVLAVAVALAAALLIGSRLLWRVGIRRYTGASA